MTDSSSAIDWFLDSDASIRWQVMRDLLDAPESEWKAERAKVDCCSARSRSVCFCQWDGVQPHAPGHADMERPQMTFEDSYRRIRLALDHLIERAPERWDVAPPPPPSKLAQLIDEAGPLAPGLQAYFDCCNGVSVRGDDGGIFQLFSIEDMLRIDTPGYFAISHDGCGDYILVARDLEVGAGAVLFLEHEGCYLSSLLASSLVVYVEDWVAGVSPHRNREGPLDDPTAQALLRDERFMAQLGPDGSARVELEYVDPTGKVSYGRNPATGERVQIVPRRKRRRSLDEQ